MRKDALQLGAKIEFALMLAVIERLDAHAVARKNEPLLGLHPDGNGKHSTQMRKAFAPPAQERMQNHFGIAAGFKVSAVGFQFKAQLVVVKDLTVEDHDHIAIRANQRLVATLQVENAQASSSQRNQFRGEAALMVRSAVHERIERSI